jgi:hypothetical protein
VAGSRLAKEMKMGSILFITPSNNTFNLFANLCSSRFTLTPKGRGEGKGKFNFQV